MYTSLRTWTRTNVPTYNADSAGSRRVPGLVTGKGRTNLRPTPPAGGTQPAPKVAVWAPWSVLSDARKRRLPRARATRGWRGAVSRSGHPKQRCGRPGQCSVTPERGVSPGLKPHVVGGGWCLGVLPGPLIFANNNRLSLASAPRVASGEVGGWDRWPLTCKLTQNSLR